MLKSRIIVGVDPGTTVAWAILNLNGELIASGSRKEFDLDSLVSLLAGYGRVVAVGCDKAKIPGFVGSVATKFGALVFSPNLDLKVDEKRDSTRGFSVSNSHELDACASALLAFRKVQPLLNKVRSFLSKEDKLSLFEDVFEFVLKEQVSIRAAVSILAPVQVENSVENSEEQSRDGDVVSLFSALSRVRKDNAVLLRKNSHLSSKVVELENRILKLKEKNEGLVKPKSSAEIAKLREGRIASLSQRLKNALSAVDAARSKIVKLEHSLLREDIFVLPRFSRLSWDDVLKNDDWLNNHSVIFVDDANEFSERAVSKLHASGVDLVVCGVLPGERARSRLPFACVRADYVELFDNLVFVKKDWLNRARSDRAVLFKVVEEYQNRVI